VLGRNADAERVLHTLQSRSKENYISPYLVATIYAGLGEKAAAFKLLEEAYQQRSPDLVWYLKTDPRIDNLRAEPQFQALLQRTGFSN
jgi:hypothetical protein